MLFIVFILFQLTKTSLAQTVCILSALLWR